MIKAEVILSFLFTEHNVAITAETYSIAIHTSQADKVIAPTERTEHKRAV